MNKARYYSVYPATQTSLQEVIVLLLVIPFARKINYFTQNPFPSVLDKSLILKIIIDKQCLFVVSHWKNWLFLERAAKTRAVNWVEFWDCILYSHSTGIFLCVSPCSFIWGYVWLFTTNGLLPLKEK